EPEEEPELAGADVAAFDPPVDAPTGAPADTGVVELAAEVEPTGPQAVIASPATTRTAVERPQRAVLVRMVSLFRY
ncbi:hypothetical protein, partial [Streptomyces sp. NPDC005866]